MAPMQGTGGSCVTATGEEGLGQMRRRVLES